MKLRCGCWYFWFITFPGAFLSFLSVISVSIYEHMSFPEDLEIRIHQVLLKYTHSSKWQANFLMTGLPMRRLSPTPVCCNKSIIKLFSVQCLCSQVWWWAAKRNDCCWVLETSLLGCLCIVINLYLSFFGLFNLLFIPGLMHCN